MSNNDTSPIINTHRCGLILADISYGTMQADPDRNSNQRVDTETGAGLFTAAMPRRRIRDDMSREGREVYVARGSCYQRTNRETAASAGVSFRVSDKDKDKISKVDADKIYKAICEKFVDARLFGQLVPGLPGMLRGPVQLSWGVSVDPVRPTTASITRCAVATEKEEADQNEGNKTMGRTSFIPYGLFRLHFYVNPHDAKRTGCTEADYEDFLKKISYMFENSRSTTRASATVRAIYEFRTLEHADGVIHSQQLLEAIQVRRRDPSTPARSFSDYEIVVPRKILARDGQDFVFRKVVDDRNPWLDDAEVAAE